MKELSIEEKARAYDEALAKAVEIHRNYKGRVRAVDVVIEEVFPEFKEGDDERIRKELINYFLPVDARDSKKQEWIAWLKKQGEQKLTWSKEDDKILKSIIINIENLQFSEDIQEKYRHIPNANKSYYQIKIDWLKSLKDRVVPQPKQEWKRENTDDLTDFENAMMHIGGSFFGQHAGLNPNNTNAVKEQANFLLELVPSRVWNGGDEAHLHSLITHLEQWIQSNPDTTGADIQGENIAWLKSLKLRNTWKPSDEQMEALSNALSLAKNCGEENAFDLNTLYEQLKKLKA